MDKIINVLLLIIIFVFDPLAISLVIASNFAFEKAYPKKKYKENLYGEIVDETLQAVAYEKALRKAEKEFDWDAAEKRMEIIGQNGNDGEHYSKYDLNKDGVVDKNEIEIAKARIKEIKNKKGGDLQINSRLEKEIFTLQKLIDKHDDLTKTY